MANPADVGVAVMAGVLDVPVDIALFLWAVGAVPMVVRAWRPMAVERQLTHEP